VTGFAQSEKGYDYWALVKLDHEVAEQNNIRSENAVTSLTWSSPHCFPSEAIFVANPTENKEDNGVLLSQVYDGAKEETFLLVLDAQDMSELARYYTGTRCPVSFHGAFVLSK
jgi:carotenoid cleavage dioxygenase-like enzyme